MLPLPASSFISLRYKLQKLKYPKLTLLMILSVIIFLAIFPIAYRESWLDPFSTLNVPNRILHPLSITKIGMMDPNDPYHPSSYSDQSQIHALMKDLQQAEPLPYLHSPEELVNQKVRYFTLHREETRYHKAFDYPLQYYPQEKTVRFGQQEFQVNDATILLLNDIAQKMQPGWWN